MKGEAIIVEVSRQSQQWAKL